MLRRIKYGKIAIVIFITALIWVWADLRKTEEFPASGATIGIAASTSPNLWVSFSDESSVSIEKIVLKGSTAKIDDLKKKLREGKPVLNFAVDPEELVATTSGGEYPLDVLNFLKQSEQISQLGLTVTSCEPKTLNVQVVTLVKRSLTVECFDENKIPLKAESIEPSKVDMFVPEDWQGEKLVAKVQLTRREINQAMLSAIAKTPYIELSAGQYREVATAVKIKMPPAEERLKGYTITTATLGFSLSENLQGKYKVQVTNLNEVISPIAIRATPEAKQAYESMRYQVILEIDDEDIKTEEFRREVVYNFPEEFVGKEEIALNQTPVQARFKLVPISPEPE